MKIAVSQLIVKFIERLGINTIFGMPGAHILPVYDALYDSKVQSVLAKHEQGAAFMAGGYARASGKIAACITTAGPGATNLVTGIANAYADKQPILVITGETSTHIFGKGGLQESSGEGGSIDQNALFQGITQYNKIIERTDYLANVLNQAAKILCAPNSGPVLLSFPFNVQNEMVDTEILEQINIPINQAHKAQEDPALSACYELLMAAKRPVIVAGYGCIQAGAQTLLTTLSETMNIPVCSSLKGKGAISEQSPLALGSLGVTSYSPAYQYLVEQSDLLILLGASFNERTSYLWDKKLLGNKKIIQVDKDYAQLEKVFQADITLCGDIKTVLQSLLNKIKVQQVQPKRFDLQTQPQTSDNTERVDNKAALQKQFPLIASFFKQLALYFPKGIQVFDDNIIFAQNFFQVSKDNRYYPNSGISSLGHAIPAAIGARFAVDKPSFVIIGDGGFQMCCMEIMTAVNYQIPVTIVMLNNATMGLIRKNQTQHYQKRFINCDFINPDYQALAASFGISYTKLSQNTDIQALFKDKALGKQTQLVEIELDKDNFPGYSSGRA
ncbi:thiamine pyrophosphate-binding protein [Candidatus Venteria ishoeyi]|uniref:thiamine pyrophosphate-binding protein n=1 Tax=Candidatus Venteria ishoeyi TaxID=1899563 RepID=UPI0025A54355|nr:thiamine pyrophosphate-binding protein [Candidatus Venteria ishoeyi]MDM8548149.1 thiamine pyrophosphate-binding protein [Candidatus Venteria ishoeyi]